jgi:hypothetical protein
VYNNFRAFSTPQSRLIDSTVVCRRGASLTLTMNLHNSTLKQKRIEQERKARDRAEKDRKEKEEKDKKKKPDSPADKYGKNMCKYAWRGNLKRVQRCIRKGGSVEYQNPLSLSRPVHRACLGGSLEVVKFLGEWQSAKFFFWPF